jgi:hypothetical protein
MEKLETREIVIIREHDGDTEKSKRYILDIESDMALFHSLTCFTKWIVERIYDS